jgi:GNAT superfamily N-acetyltransferase
VKNTPTPFVIRPAVPDDSAMLVNLVRELAVYEQLEAFARATPDDFRAHLFGPERAAEAILAEVNGDAVGFAVFFTTFSTFRGRKDLYLEDLFVRHDRRGLGIGKALLAAVAQHAMARGCARLEWAVLNWNDPAIAFYVSVGARPMTDWTAYRLDEDALARLATGNLPA